MFRKRNTGITNNYNNINLDIDYEKLAQEIVKAEREANALEEAEILEQKEIEDARLKSQRDEILESFDYSIIKCEKLKNFLLKFNDLIILVRIIFLPKKHMDKFSAMPLLMKIAVVIFMHIFRYFLYLTILALTVLSVLNTNYLILIPVAFFVFIIAQIMRIAEHEVNNSNDNNFIMNTFTNLLAFVSIMIACVALFTGNDTETIRILEEIKYIIQNLTA